MKVTIGYRIEHPTNLETSFIFQPFCLTRPLRKLLLTNCERLDEEIFRIRHLLSRLNRCELVKLGVWFLLFIWSIVAFF